MKKWEVSLIGGVAITILLSACGRTAVKNETIENTPTPTAEKPAEQPDDRFARTAAAHNRIRGEKNLPPLSWSDSLASYAGEWANQLAAGKDCNMEHRPGSGTFKQEHGENLYWASARVWTDGRREVQAVTIDEVVNDWASEVKDYDYASNTCSPGKQCGHYTQVVWKDTTSVGCAYKQCGDSSQLWVCNYSPAGNIIGQKPY